MKLKNKLILDAILLMLMIVLMDYSLTGGFLHELLGIVILAGFIIHVVINRKYYGAMIKAIKNGKASTKSKVSFAVDVMLPIAAIVMLISSLAISQDLFPGIAALFSGSLWVPIHIVCATVMLVCITVHVFMHAGMISAYIKKGAENATALKTRNALMRIMAFLFAVLVVKSSYSGMVDAASLLPSANNNDEELNQNNNKQNNELVIEGDDQTDDDGYVIEIEPEPEPEETSSLDDYLSTLYCNGCHRHCCLLTPQCGKGEQQASQAAADFYENYSEQAV